MSVEVLHGDCLEVLPTLAADSIDVVVTDPPYELNFMNRRWDNTGMAFRPETWAQVLRVMKPGAHLVAFGGTRTYHRMACAIEDAGFEVRDTLAWLYGSGFPKSHDVSKAIDRAAGAEREVVGHTAHPDGRPRNLVSREAGVHEGGQRLNGVGLPLTAPATDAAKQWAGWGTALKPAFEPIILARKPLGEATIAANVLRHGTGAINVDACRVGTTKDVPASPCRSDSKIYGRGSSLTTGDTAGFDPSVGRWPANVCHDGSDEVLAAFATYGERTSGSRKAGEYRKVGGAGIYSDSSIGPMPAIEGNAGTGARFFMSAKAGPDDRLGSKHPTVKPVSLMRWLVRLVCPPGGLVCDPFAGSGTTGMACLREGFDAVLIEREAEHVADIRHRLAHIGGEDTPLFAAPDDEQPSLFSEVA